MQFECSGLIWGSSSSSPTTPALSLPSLKSRWDGETLKAAVVLGSLRLSATDTLPCSLWEFLWESPLGFTLKQFLCLSCKQTMGYCCTGYISDSRQQQSEWKNFFLLLERGNIWLWGQIRTSCALFWSCSTCFASLSVFFVSKKSVLLKCVSFPHAETKSTLP